jgi:putative cell wall-binding protein
VVTSQLEGVDRVAVSISASNQLSARGAVPVVYLVAANPDSEAAAAAPAATLEGGAILHAGATALAPAVAAELVRLEPGRVEVVGGTSTIGKAVVSQVSSLLGEGTSVERMAGRAAPETAALLSARLFAPSAPIVFVASADAYFDALVAASAAPT